MQLAHFYKYHGINIKTCYADFDKHHIGVVTESQVSKGGTNWLRCELLLAAGKSISIYSLKNFTL